MSNRTKRIGLAVVTAALVTFAGASSGLASETERPQPAPTEQTGMWWIEFVQCVRTVQSQAGSWSYAAQQCENVKPQDPPEPPVRSTERAPVDEDRTPSRR